MQTREEWLKWRQGGLGSSDYPIIMGDYTFRTLMDVYEDKVAAEVKEDQRGQWIKDRGNRIEPRIRSLFEMDRMESFNPVTCIMDQFEFMRVSLDGRAEDKKRGIEIKMLGKKDWEALKNKKKIPEKYVAQVQGQILVANLDLVYFLGYLYDKDEKKALSLENLVVVEVFPDREYQGRLLEGCSKFWFENVVKRKPPVAKTQDYQPLVGLAEVAALYKEACVQIALLEKQRDSAKKALIEEAEKTGHSRLLCAGIKMRQESRVGAVQYAKIPELQGVDLEKYRGDGTSYWKLELESK